MSDERQNYVCSQLYPVSNAELFHPVTEDIEKVGAFLQKEIGKHNGERCGFGIGDNTFGDNAERREKEPCLCTRARRGRPSINRPIAVECTNPTCCEFAREI